MYLGPPLRLNSGRLFFQAHSPENWTKGLSSFNSVVIGTPSLFSSVGPSIGQHLTSMPLPPDPGI